MQANLPEILSARGRPTELSGELRRVMVELLRRNSGDVIASANDLDTVLEGDDTLRIELLRMILRSVKDKEELARPTPPAPASFAAKSAKSSTTITGRGFVPPTPINRQAAVRSGGEAARAALLYTFRLTNGRLLADVTFGELPDLIKADERQAEILRRLIRLKPRAPKELEVGKIYRPEAFDKIVSDVDGGRA